MIPATMPWLFVTTMVASGACTNVVTKIIVRVTCCTRVGTRVTFRCRPPPAPVGYPKHMDGDEFFCFACEKADAGSLGAVRYIDGREGGLGAMGIMNDPKVC